MKKILILLVCLLPVITFTSCDDKDDIRKDIDDLNARLDALTDEYEHQIFPGCSERTCSCNRIYNG